MITTPADLARAAARCSTELNPALPAQVEARLQARGGKTARLRRDQLQAGGTETAPPSRYLEPTLAVALASLLVNIAALAWKIYEDLRSNAKAADATPAPEVLARRLRLEIELPQGVSEAQRDRLIDAVLEELQQRPDQTP